MRILFATHQAVGLQQGGVRTQMMQTKSALEELGVNVTMFEMWKEFDRTQFDLVHLFSANMATYHLARAFWLRDVPLIVTPVFYTRRSNKVVRTVIALDRLANRFVRGVWSDYGIIAEMCGWAKAVLPNTEDEVSLLQKGFGVLQEKIHLVPNGVEERFSKATSELFERQYGIKDFILYVGHIGPFRKNVLHLLEALESIDHPAVLIGPIEDSPSGRACLERAKRNPRLLILDGLPHDSMLLASAYAACKVFVLPSMYETPGIAALEAALTGANIAITSEGGTREYFAELADYLNPNSADDIKRCILSAFNKPKSSALAERIRSRYLWSEVGNKTKAIYESILSSL